MSSVINTKKSRQRGSAPLLGALLLGALAPSVAFSQPLMASEPQIDADSVFDATPPFVVAAAETAEIIPAKPGEMLEAAEAAEQANTVNAEESFARAKEAILQRLSSDSREPLTLADLAALNDVMQRAEYLGQLQAKIGGTADGTQQQPIAGSPGAAAILQRAASPVGQPSSFSSGGQGGGSGSSNYSVLRIIGSKGAYTAVLVGSDNRQIQVRAGDFLPGDLRIASVGVGGVRLVGPGGPQDLPFISTGSLGGVSFIGQPGR